MNIITTTALPTRLQFFNRLITFIPSFHQEKLKELSRQYSAAVLSINLSTHTTLAHLKFEKLLSIKYLNIPN